MNDGWGLHCVRWFVDDLGDDGMLAEAGKADDSNICWKLNPILDGESGWKTGVPSALGVFSGLGRPVMILVAGLMSEEGSADSRRLAQEGMST